MIRKQLMTQDRADRNPFRWRGGEVSRIEGFSDAVFGFALTLLVVSLEVPKSFGEMMAAMRGFLAFGFCFALLFTIWLRHYYFFRHYGLQDGVTIALNGVLLFVVLFYVYPLKFVFTLLAAVMTGMRENVPQITQKEVPVLFIIYGLGFATVFSIFALLHLNAYRQRHKLELNAFEAAATRLGIWRDFTVGSVGLFSALTAWLLPPNLSGLSGFLYFAIAIIEGVFGAKEGNLHRRNR
jgi:uncharacterized membrane protein